MLADYPVTATIPASDLERARAFYRDAFGLEPVEETPAGLTYRAADGTGFFLYPTPNAGQSPNTLMSWRIDDMDKVVGELRARGVVLEDYDMPGLKTVDGIATMDGGRSAWFKDSEGNVLNVTQMPPG